MPYPDWTSLAPLVLAMSLAYLRLEVFSARRQIKEHAQKALRGLSEDPAQIPEGVRDMEMYKQLQVFAGERKATRASMIWYQRMWDRTTCVCIAGISGAAVVIAPFVRLECPDEWFGISLTITIILLVCLVVEVFFVLYSGLAVKNSRAHRLPFRGTV